MAERELKPGGLAPESGIFSTELQLREANTKARLKRAVSTSKRGRERRNMESAPSDQGQDQNLLPKQSWIDQSTTRPHHSPERKVEVLTPSASECDLIWMEGVTYINYVFMFSIYFYINCI